LHEFFKISSHDAHIHLEIGHLLLKTGDRQGVGFLDLVMEMPTGLAVECCRQIVKYMVHSDDMNQAQTYRRITLSYQVAT
jgi:hypothetical protein